MLVPQSATPGMVPQQLPWQPADHHFALVRLPQASTGQTTGIWFVSFCSPSARACKELAPEWEALGKEMLQSQVLLGWWCCCELAAACISSTTHGVSAACVAQLAPPPSANQPCLVLSTLPAPPPLPGCIPDDGGPAHQPAAARALWHLPPAHPDALP